MKNSPEFLSKLKIQNSESVNMFLGIAFHALVSSIWYIIICILHAMVNMNNMIANRLGIPYQCNHKHRFFRILNSIESILRLSWASNLYYRKEDIDLFTVVCLLTNLLQAAVISVSTPSVHPIRSDGICIQGSAYTNRTRRSINRAGIFEWQSSNITEQQQQQYETSMWSIKHFQLS